MSDNVILKLMISAQILMLILVIVGATDAYNLLRWDVLLVTVVLAVISITTRRYYWGIVFIGFAILFNPLATPSLSKQYWILADTILVCVLLYWSFDFFQNYHKGLLFERFVVNRFSEAEWGMVTYTKDLRKKLRRFVESDTDPDMVFRKKINNKVVAFECKYRSFYGSHPQWGKGIFWDKTLGERYMHYQLRTNTPVYIALGVGGNPKSPLITAFIPLDIIQKQYFKFIPKSVIEAYQDKPTV